MYLLCVTTQRFIKQGRKKMNKRTKTIVFLCLLVFGFSVFGQSIHEAVQKGDIKTVKKLLEDNPQLVNKENDSRTPLHIAAMQGKKEIAELIIKKGADVNIKDKNGITPLMYASVPGNNQDIVDLLLSNGAEITIFEAITLGKKDLIKSLLSKGTDINIENNMGLTPLYVSIVSRKREIAELLIDNGADINKKLQGLTPLIGTITFGEEKIAELLIKKGADINTVGDDGSTALSKAVDGGFTKLVDILLKKGADFNIKENRYKRTLLHTSALKGYSQIAGFLIEKGINVNEKDDKGKTPLYYAAKYGHRTVADLLRKNGSKKVSLEENYGYSSFLEKNLKDKEAAVWYLNHSGWAVRTKNNLLIFDYDERGSKPDEPLLTNGYINPDEIKKQNVYVFVTHEHGDHFNKKIFDWHKKIRGVNYILGFEFRDVEEIKFIPPRENRKIGDLEITTIESNDGGVGFLVKADGLTIFHAGDHANRKEDFSGHYKAEIDFLAKEGLFPDIAFVPVTGCGFRNPEAVKKGAYYLIEKLNPKIFFPMHAGGAEYQYKNFADQASNDNIKVDFVCAENRGDRFFYRNGKIK